MGIRVTCPNGHTLNVKEHLAGRVGRCPKCGGPVRIPEVSEAPEAQGPGATVGAPPPATAAPAASSPPPVPATEVSPPRAAVAPEPLAAGPLVVVAEEPLVVRSGTFRDPRLVAKRRARQRRMALIALSVLSLALAALLAWVLLRQ